MNIVCCIHSLAGGGAEHLMAGLTRELAFRHRVVLLTLDRTSNDLYEISAPVERLGLDLMQPSPSPLHALRNNYRRMTALRQAIRKLAPDVVLSFCDQMNVLTLLACRPLNLPVVAAEMSDPRFHPMPRLWRWLRPRAYRRAAAIVAISQASRPTVSRLFGREAGFIPPAVDSPPENVTPDPPPSGRRRLVSLGRLSPEKRFDWLIRAFADLAHAFPDWDLEIAGAGPCRDELQTTVVGLELANRIRLRGRVPEIWGFLQASHAFASSSLYEGTPVAVLEAMQVGLPVVAVDCDSGMNEVIAHEQNGLLTKNSIAGLAEGLKRIMQDGELRERLGNQARVTASHYSWERFVAQYEQLLSDAAAHRPRA